MDAVRFAVLLFMIKTFANAISVQLTSSSDKATAGVDFTFTCVTDARAIYMTRNATNECLIVGSYPNGTCVFVGDVNLSYRYYCNNSTGVYTLTIPSSFGIASFHGSNWKCSAPVDKIFSKNIRLYVNVPITEVTITTVLADKNPIEIISDRDQLFNCKTNAGRPSSRIQWYISGTNITGSATPQDDVCNVGCNGKVISSSELTYRGDKKDNMKIIYCTAVNLEGQYVRSENKSVVIWYPPASPSITQIPQDFVDENELIILTCELLGGNPPGTISWQCDGAKPVTATDIPPSNKTVASVHLTAAKILNGKVCICIGSHLAWTQTQSSSITLQIRYSPTSSPEVTQTPSKPVMEENKVTLTCEILGGNPLPTITWQCDDFTNVIPTGLPPADKVVSSIMRVVTRLDNEKDCICTGQHPLWTTDKEVKHIVIVYYLPASPSITQIPKGSVDENELIVLTCEIIGGNPPATIAWQCNGTSPVTPTGIPPINKTVSSVQLTANKIHNSQICTCTGSNPAWTQTVSSSITLQIRYGPTSSPVVTQTPIEPVSEGNKVILSCEIAGGNPLPTIAWQCNDFTNVILTDIPPANKVISSIERVVTRLDDGKRCICTGHHPLWTIERKVEHTLIVYYSSTIEMVNEMPIIVVENKTISLVCTEMDGNPRNASIVWYKGNSNIGKNATYSIIEASPDDTGQYSCHGSNGIGNVSVAAVEVTVLYSPRVSTLFAQDRNTIAENGTAVLQCIVKSNPPPNIEWTKHGKDKILSLSENVYKSNLTIANSGCMQTNNYTCRATNVINNVEYSNMEHIELFVNCSPRRYDIQEESMNIIGVEVGQTLTIVKHILSYPKSNVTWTFNQDNNSSDIIKLSASNCSTYNLFEHTICFVRLNLTESDFGLYTAVVVNDIGNATFRSLVKPQGKPNTPANVTCIGRPNSVLLHWKSSFNGGEPQIFQIYIRKSANAIFYNYGPNYSDPGQNIYAEAEIEQLTPDTLYQFEVRASNKHNVTISDLSSCNTTSLVVDDLQNARSIAIGAGTGIGAAVIVLIIIAVIVVFIRRRKHDKNLKKDKEPMQRPAPCEEDNNVDGLKDNPLYVSSPEELDGAVYSVVNKNRQNREKKIKEIEMDCIFQNSTNITKEPADEVYANSEVTSISGQTHAYVPTKNKDGLIYADLDLAPMTDAKRFVIRGLENRNNYAVIDLTKTADPMSSDSDSDDDNTKTNNEQE